MRSSGLIERGVNVSFCGECGSKLDSDARFCGECGTPTGAGETAAAPSEPASDPTPAPAVPPNGAPAAEPGEPVPPLVEPLPTVPPPQAASAGGSSTRRTAMWIAAAAAVAAGVVGIVLVTRDDGTVPVASPTTESSVVAQGDTIAPPTSAQTATTPSTTLAPATTVAPTTSLAPTTTAAPATTLAPTTTAAPPTTVPPTTAPPSTAPPSTAPPATTAPDPAVPPGWSPAAFPMQAYPLAFEGNWTGVPSPAIVDPAAPLPDGLYNVNYVSQDTWSLTVDVRRFELCSVVGDAGCWPGPWASDEIGLTDVIGRATLPLDTTVRVAILGWECGEIIAQGNGPDLSDIYTTLYQDYDAAFGPGLAGGLDPSFMIDQVRATPVGGFGPPPASCDDGFSLQWRHGGAPPFLVQWPFDWETGGWLDPARLVPPTMIEIDGPITTVFLYAGFYS